MIVLIVIVHINHAWPAKERGRMVRQEEPHLALHEPENGGWDAFLQRWTATGRRRGAVCVRSVPSRTPPSTRAALKNAYSAGGVLRCWR